MSSPPHSSDPAPPTYRVPRARSESAVSLVLGLAFAAGLFVLMALAQMIGDVRPTPKEIEETVAVFAPPEVEELEEEEPPPSEEEEPLPELEKEPPQLSLEQLDIALNPGTGGSLAGDFAMPTISASSKSLGTEDFVDFSQLDQMPRPIGVSGFNFPRRLLRKKVNGKVVLLIKLDETGRVMEASVDSSTLPDFSDFVRETVAEWRFTPPTQQGQPVRAHARLPIPIHIR